MDWEATLSGKFSIGKNREIAHFLLNNHLDVETLTCFLQHGNPAVSWRAAWILDTLAKHDSSLTVPYFQKYIDTLLITGNYGVKRHLTRLLCDVEPGLLEDARVFDICLKWIIDKKSPVAVKVNAMSLAANFCSVYPELAPELLFAIKAVSNDSSAGFKARSRMLFKTHLTHSISGEHAIEDPE